MTPLIPHSTRVTDQRKPWGARLGACLALVAVVGIGCGSDDPNPIGPGVQPAPGKAECIEDQDGDGYGKGCPAGLDCDDADPAVTTQCYACAVVEAGCPCTKEGQTIECGEVAAVVGNTISCTVGERVCKDGTWGECMVGSTPKSYRTRGLGSAVACDANPCDPMCQQFPDDPEPGLPGCEDENLSCTDEGVSLTPGPLEVGGPIESCVSETQEAEPLPLDMYVMIDTSGSMNYCPDSNNSCGANSRWAVGLRPALEGFVKSPDSRGIGFGMQRFPPPGSCNTVTYNPPAACCALSSYSAPAVAIAPLDDWLTNPTGHTNDLLDEWASWTMVGGTPTSSALGGAIERARAQALANPTHKVVVILATDGDPTFCPGNGAEFSQDSQNAAISAAQTGFAGSPSIETYVIGVGPGASAARLHQIARAGQGITDTSINPAYIVATGNPTALLNAMNDIRRQALPCEFALPKPSEGAMDPDTTELTYDPNDGGSVEVWPRTQSACPTDGSDGWYYDSATAPTKIVLCPDTCVRLTGNLFGKVSFDFDCIDDCSPRRSKAEPTELNMYISVDRSGSMNETVGTGETRWDRVRESLKAFVNDSGSEGMNAALHFFPQYVAGQDCNYTAGNSCNLLDYYGPTVNLGGLVSPNASLISDALDAASACGSTPTAMALQGALTKAREMAISSDKKTVVVLATDGMPTSCDNTCTPLNNDCNNHCMPCGCWWNYSGGITCSNMTAVNCFLSCRQACGLSWATCSTTNAATFAAAAYADTPSIPTYVIGAGVDATTEAFLDQIALAGGSTEAFIANDTNPTAFLNAMNSIRAKEMPCDYVLPSPTAGALDISGTSVHYIDSSGAEQTWERVAPGDCGSATGLAWHYDNNTSPTKLELCPSACDYAKADGGEIELEYSCQGQFITSSFTREYDMTDQCPPGTAPVWGIWSWEAETPSDSAIDFHVSVLQPNGTYSDFVPLVFVKPLEPVPAWWSTSLSGSPVGANAANGTQEGFTVVHDALAIAGLPVNAFAVRIRSGLIAATDGFNGPTLKAWNLQASCQPTE